MGAKQSKGDDDDCNCNFQVVPCLSLFCPPWADKLGKRKKRAFDPILGTPLPDTPTEIKRRRARQLYGGLEREDSGDVEQLLPNGHDVPRYHTSQPIHVSRGLMQRGQGMTDERRLLKKYQLHEVLGVGSTSVCHRCILRSTGKSYACKIIDKYQMEQRFAGMLEQFHTEIEALQSLKHPNIIKLYDVYTTKEKIYIVMEYMAGGELFDYVVKKGTLTEAEASTIVRMVTSALCHMHSRNIIHRDLKPENLMLTRKPNSVYDIDVKIIDFGLSKVLEEPMAKSFLGTRGYLAPEMLQRRGYSKKIDTWALGVIVFILVCGCLPFDDDPSKLSADEDIRKKFKLRLPKWAKDLSPSAKDLLMHLLDSNTETRYSAEQAMVHPWVEGSTAPKDSLLKSPGRMMLTPGKAKSPYAATNRTQMNQIMAGRARANSNSRPHRQIVRKKSI